MVTQGAVPVVRKTALALVKPLMNGQVVLGFAPEFSGGGFGMMIGMGHGFLGFSKLMLSCFSLSLDLRLLSNGENFAFLGQLEINFHAIAIMAEFHLIALQIELHDQVTFEKIIRQISRASIK